ncbi:MAG: NAD(P)-binding domain-containing protein [Gammaproteobacteria bacterium]|nr:NAD(P)-binding domain-containing protein [Gammaproteobacteria bacterium]MBT8106277.1 NAD(P)-binding domain-containing protein [Gammaproteobacteria bacterium]NNF48681.1 NAD(P)-binding domain-containing protein [Woeseiaceae bacterium]NNK26291.1 NAD(P)-binding domain-containing protein [Woeseiaceae bacterium]NNL63554.1 NAD(P)-binding domain-containing protein [Woeseiaceae bacterium]
MLRRTLIAALLLAANAAWGDTVAVIGTGNVGMALGTEFAGLGHDVIYGSRTPDSEKTQALVATTKDASAASPAEAAAAADVVVLATPGMVTERVVKGLGDLAGKIIIDVTNPLIFEGNPPVVTYGTERSLGEIVQEAHPDAHVVKAFNTIGWRVMIDPPTPAPVIPLAGNDAEAKQKVAGWAREMGIESVDVGGIYHARATEYLIVMMLNNNFTGPGGFTLEFRQLD